MRKLVKKTHAYLYTLLCNVICWWVGHKVGKINDSGYDVCERCEKHEYYDYKTWYKGQPLHKLYRKVRQIPINIKTWYRCRFFTSSFGKWIIRIGLLIVLVMVVLKYFGIID